MKVKKGKKQWNKKKEEYCMDEEIVTLERMKIVAAYIYIYIYIFGWSIFLWTFV